MRKIKCDNIQCRRADTCANYLPWEPCTISRSGDGDSCSHYQLSEGQTPVGNFDCERCHFSEIVKHQEDATLHILCTLNNQEQSAGSTCVFFSSRTVKDQLNSKIKII